MQAELIAIVEETHDAGMSRNILIQLPHITNIAYSLLKAAHKAWSETHHRDAQSLEFRGDIKVFQQRGGGARLVHRHLHLKWSVAQQLLQALRHTRRMGHSTSILGKRLMQRIFVEYQGMIIQRKIFEI